MRQIIKAGFTAGILGFLIVLLFGGWSSALLGAILGAVAGLLVTNWQHPGRAVDGIRLGLLAGLAAGILIALGEVAYYAVIAGIAGIANVNRSQGMPAAGTAILLGAVFGALIGGIDVLPERSRRVAFLVIGGLFLLLYPAIDAALLPFGTSGMSVMVLVMIFCVLALGLNIVVGYAGLLDLGYAAFFAIGAYTTGFLASPQLGIQWNFWIVIWIAAAVAAIFGLILGSPTLPLRGDYLAIVTLGFGEIVPIVFRNLISITIKEPITSILAVITNNPSMAICLAGCTKPINLTGGVQGINPIVRPELPGVAFTSQDVTPWFYLILVIIIGSVFFINRLRVSRLGRAWTALREDELAASAMGIDIVRTKLLAFAMGATFSGFAGAFYGSYIRAIFPDVFDFSVSVIVLCMVILGGLGNMTGVILGGIIIEGADRLVLPQMAQVLKGIMNTSVLPHVSDPYLKDFFATSIDPIQWRLLLFGLTLVIMMIVRPEGLVPSARRRAELHAKGSIVEQENVVESEIEATGMQPRQGQAQAQPIE